MSKELKWNDYPSTKPKCNTVPDSLGVPVLAWVYEEGSSDKGYAKACYYGYRMGPEPMFYKYGAEIRSVLAWMYLPKYPNP